MKGEFVDYIDISPILSTKTAVFPGDEVFSLNTSMSFEKGDHLKLSSMSSTLHIGAHADAPSHYHKNGEDISERSLHYYMGLCQVIEVNVPKDARIEWENIKTDITAPRVLFKTGSFFNPNEWSKGFNSLSVEVIERLSETGCCLIGIDTPSVDPETSKELEAHNVIYEQNMAILEGLVLDHVVPGHYELIALPLRIKHADASPVRAILKPL